MPLVPCLHVGPLHRPYRGVPKAVRMRATATCKDRDRGDYFEVSDRQTSSSTKNVAADELSWFAIEVVE